MPELKRNRKRTFTLQWHVTAHCPNNCTHCYLQNSEGYQSEIEDELNLEQCFNIVDDYYQMITDWGVAGRINFTGGDPLLKEGIIDLIDYAHGKGMIIGILGNGEDLNLEKVLELKKVGVTSYQVSIDGTEEIHDQFRQKGSFQKNLEAIALINQAGIRSVVMSTVSKENIKEFPEMVRTVAEAQADVFDFARLVPIGNGLSLKEEMVGQEEYRSFLLNLLDIYQGLEEEGFMTYFGRKDHLWKLLYQELGMFAPECEDKKTIVTGCGIGINIVVIVANGNVYPCRRMPILLGKTPQENIRSIFIHSQELNKFREVERMEKCSTCDLLQYCRGCPAVAYGFSGSYFNPDPQCWRK